MFIVRSMYFSNTVCKGNVFQRECEFAYSFYVGLGRYRHVVFQQVELSNATYKLLINILPTPLS